MVQERHSPDVWVEVVTVVWVLTGEGLRSQKVILRNIGNIVHIYTYIFFYLFIYICIFDVCIYIYIYVLSIRSWLRGAPATPRVPQ